MEKLFQEHTEVMSLVLEGGNEVDIDAFSVVISNTAKILQQTTKFSDDGEYQKFVIRDVRKGSFIIDLATVIPAGIELLKVTKTSFDIFKGYMELKSFVTKNDIESIEKEDDTFKIIDNTGNIYIADNIIFNGYTDSQVIDDSITKIAKTLSNEESVTGLKLMSEKGQKELSYNPDDLKYSFDVSKLRHDKEISRSRNLMKVLKADFHGNSKWTLSLNGETVMTSIIDKEFKDNIMDYTFTRGTKIDADIEVIYSVDSFGNPLDGKPKEYKILKVYDVINEDIHEQEVLDI